MPRVDIAARWTALEAKIAVERPDTTDDMMWFYQQLFYFGSIGSVMTILDDHGSLAPLVAELRAFADLNVQVVH